MFDVSQRPARHRFVIKRLSTARGGFLWTPSQFCRRTALSRKKPSAVASLCKTLGSRQSLLLLRAERPV